MWLESRIKLMMIVAVQQGVERGQLTLDDPADVEHFLPEWINARILTGFAGDDDSKMPSAKEKITLRQNLTHTRSFI